MTVTVPLPTTTVVQLHRVGTLWETGGTPPGTEAPLAAVLGTAWANILALLELPMSITQLAAQLNATPPTVNAPLKALHRAGIVTPRRDSRVVLYQRTPVGDQLVTGPID